MFRAVATALFAVLFSISGAVPAADENDARIDFPENYRAEFENYLSLDRVQNHDQIIHLFANDIAAHGMRTTGEFPEGSILVGEVYKAKKDEDGKVIESDLGQRIHDGLALIAVMEKRSGWGDRFPVELRNGDWDMAAFKPDGARANKDLNECRACHAPLTETDHVFSFEHLDRSKVWGATAPGK